MVYVVRAIRGDLEGSPEREIERGKEREREREREDTDGVMSRIELMSE